MAVQTAIVLAGGGGGEADASVMPTPKPLLLVANRALIEYTGALLLSVGVTQLILMLDAGGEEAAKRLQDLFEGTSLRVRCVIQAGRCGTGGSLKEAEPFLGSDPFFVLGGGLFLNTDLASMIQAHVGSKAAATVGVVRTAEPAWEMERVELNERRQVKAIHRMHPMHEKRSSLRPVGLYLFDPSVLDLIPPGRYFDLKEQLFPLLVTNGQVAQVWEVAGIAREIMSMSDLYLANREALLGKVPQPPVRNGEGGGSWEIGRIASKVSLVQPVSIHPTAVICEGVSVAGPTVIGPHCEVAHGACLVESVLFPNALVEPGAFLSRCVVAEGARVKQGAVFRDTLIQDLPREIRHEPFFPAPDAWSEPGGLMLLPTSDRHGAYGAIKRGFDIVLAALSLLVLTPILALLALAVKLDSPGPWMFRQRRCGQFGREFTMYKFRTMVANAEELRRELVVKNEVDGPMFKITHDPRMTRVGRWLRATNLDELPQLWNVLRGEMSLVGPRPLSQEEMRYNARWRDLRLTVKPGMTGLWQVEAHTKTSFADWILYDLYYVKHPSLWLDLKILCKTFLTPLREFRTRKLAGEAVGS